MTKMSGSTILSINPEVYGALLLRHHPQPITSKEENELVLAMSTI
jgi:hypothetical protein